MPIVAFGDFFSSVKRNQALSPIFPNTPVDIHESKNTNKLLFLRWVPYFVFKRNTNRFSMVLINIKFNSRAITRPVEGRRAPFCFVWCWILIVTLGKSHCWWGCSLWCLGPSACGLVCTGLHCHTISPQSHTLHDCHTCMVLMVTLSFRPA